MTSESTLAGKRIGPYRIERELGRGGMGTVYLASRDDDEYQSRVALKLIHPGADDESVTRRFQRERQILASLEHPNIARLYDGGTTSEGTPYFVMEAIEGVPINKYCDERQLAVRARLELFRQVCAAVQLAHQNLVVHRDIKPGNILVTAEGVPKLLDFGIAKLLEPEPGDDGAPVENAMSVLLPMTPHFASPEQLSGRAITTASDVFSLGVVLYHLLTGRLPYHTGGPVQLAEMVSRMLREDTRAPSAVVVRAENVDEETTLAEISRRRKLLPQQLSRQLSGDLDNIVLKALRTNPLDRYSSVEQLSEDLRRHLEGLPVLARPATLGYRMSKYVRRHRFGVAAATAILGLLIAFGVAMALQVGETTRQRDIAELERDKAQKVSDFLVDIFGVVDPGEARGNSITAREVLDRGARRVGQELSDQPLVQAALLISIGRVYGKLGLYDEAEKLLEEALEKRRSILGEEHLDVAESLDELGLVYLLKGDYDRPEPLYQQALGIRRRLLPEGHLKIATTLSHLGDLYSGKGDYEKSETFFQEALRIVEATPDSEVELIFLLNDFAAVVRRNGDLERAQSFLERAVELGRRVLGDDHPDQATSLHNLAGTYLDQGQPERAEPLFRQAQGIYDKTLEPHHMFRAAPLKSLAAIYLEAGDFAASERALFQVREIYEAKFSARHPYVAITEHDLGLLYYRQGKLERAETFFRRAVEIYEATLGKDHPWLATSLHYLGKVRRYRGDPDEAEALLRRTLDIRRQALDGDHHHVALTLQALAGLAASHGRHDETRDLLQKSLAIRERRAANDPTSALEQCRLASVLTGLGRLHAELGEAERSQPLLERAAALTHSLAEDTGNAEILSTRVLALLALGRVDEARPLAERLLGRGFAEPELVEACREAGLSPGQEPAQPAKESRR